MREADRAFFAARRQLLQTEFADRFEQGEARLLTVVRPLDEALVDEGGEEIENGDGQTDRRTDGQTEPVMLLCPSPATASAASRVKPPAKTARRRKRACSSGARRS
jgi:hypothetical protein